MLEGWRTTAIFFATGIKVGEGSNKKIAKESFRKKEEESANTFIHNEEAHYEIPLIY